jgi:hypothetical protein
MDANDERHGTRRGYYAHRRDNETACDRCKRAAAAAEAARQLNLMRGRPGRIDSTGTQRRLQALVALGWNWRLLGKHLETDAWVVQQWAERDHAYVFTKTAERVADLYERLSMQFPPETTGLERGSAKRARGRAQRMGWPPPLAWDAIDDPTEQPRGVRVEGKRRDLLAEWHDLRDAGESIEQAAVRLGVTVGAIERAEYRKAAA